MSRDVRTPLVAVAAGSLAAGGHFVPEALAPVFLVGGTFLLLLIAERERRYRYGLLFGLAYFAPLSLWLGQFVSRWVGGWALGGFVWVLVTVLLALPLALVVPLAHRAFASGRGWAVPLVWIVLELFRSYVPVFAFPWGLLAHPAAGWVSIFDVAPLVGEFGVSGLLVALAVLFVRWRGMAPRARAGALGFAILVLVGGAVNGRLTPRAIPFSLAAYQPGFDLAYARPPVAPEAVRRAIAEARREQDRLGADLMVLPEGLVAVRTGADLPPMAGPGALLLGGQRRAGETAYQTAFAFDGASDGGGWRWADKTRLVIFGEFVPGRGIVPYPESFHLPGGDLAAGEAVAGFALRGRGGEARRVRVGPILCFEALFPDIAFRQKLQGADALAVMSLDDWFGGTAAPGWLAQASRWRALETRRPVVRVGSMGLTRIYDARGALRGSLPWGASGTVSVPVSVPVPVPGGG